MGKHRHTIGHLVTLNPLHILPIFYKLMIEHPKG